MAFIYFYIVIMNTAFEKFVSKHNLFAGNSKILVALSGGIDSVVLLHLLITSGYDCAAAHCNFNLRGSESQEDELFVRKLARKYGIEIFTKSFGPGELQVHNSSIQMSARELRYTFFSEISESNNFSVVATAHHADDSLETFFINLLRGTGIKGLSGIPLRNGNIVRPLLFAFRSDIEKYAVSNHLSWRTDSSNLSDKYFRNKIRNNLIPMLETLNPNFRETISNCMSNLGEINSYFEKNLALLKKKLIKSSGNNIVISTQELFKHPSPELILFHIVSQYGFNPDQSKSVWNSLNSAPGKMFYSDRYSLNKDRNSIIITPLSSKECLNRYYIDESLSSITEPFNMSIKSIPLDKNFELIKGNKIAFFDSELVNFPLIVRKWSRGDYFFPFGMNKAKKLSDFFIDLKIPVSEKESLWLIESAGKIIWVAGKRTDDRFRITESTKNALILELL